MKFRVYDKCDCDFISFEYLAYYHHCYSFYDILTDKRFRIDLYTSVDLGLIEIYENDTISNNKITDTVIWDTTQLTWILKESNVLLSSINKDDWFKIFIVH